MSVREPASPASTPPRRQELVVHLWLSLFNAVLVTVVATFVNAGGLPMPWTLLLIVVAFVIAAVAGTVVPAARWGGMLARRLGPRPGGVLARIVASLPVCLMMAALLSFVMTALNIGFPAYFVPAWLSGLPLAFVVSLAATVGLTPVAARLAGATSPP